MLQTPRRCSAALVATAAADAASAAAAAARAAAAAARAAAGAAAAAGAVTASERSGAEGRGHGQSDACRTEKLARLAVGYSPAFFNYKDATSATVVISKTAGLLNIPKEAPAAAPAAAKQTGGAAAGTFPAAAAVADTGDASCGEDKTATLAAGNTSSSKADRSLACRSVQQRSAGSTALERSSTTSLVREKAGPEEEEDNESAEKMDVSDKAHRVSIAANFQPNGGKSAPLPRTLSCFSSFSFKPREKQVPAIGGSCLPAPNAADDSLKKGSINSSLGSSEAGSCAGPSGGNSASLCAGRALPAAAPAAICSEKRQQAKMCETEQGNAAPLGGYSSAGSTTGEADLQPELPDESAGGPPDAQRAGCTTSETSGQGGLLNLRLITAGAADAACRSVESSTSPPSKKDVGDSSSDAYRSNCPRTSCSSQCGSPKERSSRSSGYGCRSNLNASTGNSSGNVCSSPNCGYTGCVSPAYSNGSCSSGGREGNIFVLGSARQLTPDSSRISSRMSCGGDDTSLTAQLDFVPAYAAATAGRRGGGAGATAGETTGRGATAAATGRGVATAAEEPEGGNALVDSRKEKNGEGLFQCRRGSREQGTSLCVPQKEQQEQHRRQDSRGYRPVPRCVSMPGELHSACEGMQKAQAGLPRTLTREALQLQQQEQQRKTSAGGREKTTENVLTSKYLLSSMKLDLLKLRKAEMENCPLTAVSSAASSRLPSGSRAGVTTPREFTRRDSESASSVKSYLSSRSASSSSCMLFNSGEAAASVVALTRSSPRSSEASASNVSSSSSTPAFSFSSSVVGASSLSSLASALACQGKSLLSTVLPSMVLLVEPPCEEAAAPRQQMQTAAEEAEAAAEKDLCTRYYADSRAANAAVAATPQHQYFSEWGYHGLSPLDAIEEAEERKITLPSEGGSTPRRVPTIVIQGADEVELLRGTSFRRDTIVRHSLARAKDLWEKVLSCCW